MYLGEEKVLVRTSQLFFLFIVDIPSPKYVESDVCLVPSSAERSAEAAHQNEKRNFVVFVRQFFEAAQVEQPRILERLQPVDGGQNEIQSERAYDGRHQGAQDEVRVPETARFFQGE